MYFFFISVIQQTGRVMMPLRCLDSLFFSKIAPSHESLQREKKQGEFGDAAFFMQLLDFSCFSSWTMLFKKIIVESLSDYFIFSYVRSSVYTCLL